MSIMSQSFRRTSRLALSSSRLMTIRSDMFSTNKEDEKRSCFGFKSLFSAPFQYWADRCEMELLAKRPLPVLSPDSSLCGHPDKDRLGLIDNSRHPVRQDVAELSDGHPVLLYGPNRGGKSTFIQSWVYELQQRDVHAIYIPFRTKSVFISPDEFINSFLDPQRDFNLFDLSNASTQQYRIRALLEAHAKHGKPVHVFIDDVDILTENSPVLRTLVEYASDRKVRLILISNNDEKDSDVVVPSAHRERVHFVPFEQQPDLVLEALREARYDDETIQESTKNLGYCMGDITDVLRLSHSQNEPNDVSDAINVILKDKSRKITDAVRNVSFRDDILPGNSRRTKFVSRHDFIAFLSKVTDDPTTTVNLSLEIPDVDKYTRMKRVAALLHNAHILNRIDDNTFIWRTTGFATAFATYPLWPALRASIERPRRRGTQDDSDSGLLTLGCMYWSCTHDFDSDDYD